MTTPFKPAPPASADPNYEGIMAAASLAAKAGTVIRASRDQSLQDAVGKPLTATDLPKFRLPVDAAKKPTLPEESMQMMLTLGWVAGDPIPHEIADTIGPIRQKQPHLKAIDLVNGLDPITLQKLKDAVLRARLPVSTQTNADATLQMMEAGPPTITDTPDSFADKRTEDTGVLDTACRRCGYKPGDPDPVTPTQDDKLNYLLYMRGHIPSFTKTYALFDGTCSITFRVLRVNEMEAIMTQTASDFDNGQVMRVASAYDFHVQRYRLVLATTGLVQDGTLTRVPSILTDRDSIDGDPTMPVIPRLLAWFTSKVLATESLFRIAYQAYNGFNRLVEQLELQAANADFWQGIASDS